MIFIFSLKNVALKLSELKEIYYVHIFYLIYLQHLSGNDIEIYKKFYIKNNRKNNRKVID